MNEAQTDMTRAEAIRALADKVREGKFTPEPGGPIMPSFRAFVSLADIVLPQDVRDLNGLAHNAYKGSLDAAKALHEAVLPGWWWMVDDDGDATVYTPGDRLPHDGRASKPARAWLLAILAAMEAMEDG